MAKSIKEISPTSKTLEKLSKESLKPKEYTKPVQLTARVYLEGQAMSGLLARSGGSVDYKELKRVSKEIAEEFMK